MEKNSDGFSELDRWVSKLRDLGKKGLDVKPPLMRAMRKEIVDRSNRQQDPDGRRWKRGKSSDQILQNVDAHLSIRAIGDVILARLSGRYARHDLGIVNGKVARKILPRRGITRALIRAFDEVIKEAFGKALS